MKSLDANKLMSILQRLECQDSLSIVTLLDEAGYTLIHRAAFENSYGISEYLISYYKDRLRKYMQHKESARNPGMTSEQANNIEREVRKQAANWINTPSKTD